MLVPVNQLWIAENHFSSRIDASCTPSLPYLCSVFMYELTIVVDLESDHWHGKPDDDRADGNLSAVKAARLRQDRHLHALEQVLIVTREPLGYKSPAQRFPRIIERPIIQLADAVLLYDVHHFPDGDDIDYLRVELPEKPRAMVHIVHEHLPRRAEAPHLR